MTLVNKIQTEGHAQMDYALENGVNFFWCIDVLPQAFERIIGTWLKNQADCLASKIGPNPYMREKLDFAS
jgi:aryl-alcohol dehydrogenase-like predicted oxidoreductase